MTRTKTQRVTGEVVHDPSTLARDYGFRELKTALHTLDGGPPGFDLNRDPRTRLKSDFAEYIIAKHSGVAITKLLPIRGEPPQGIAVGVGAPGAAGGGETGAAGGSGGGAKKGDDTEGEGENPFPDAGDGNSASEGQQEGSGDAEGEGQGEGESEGQDGKGDQQGDGEGEGEGSESEQPGEGEGEGEGESEQPEHPLVAEVRKVVRDETGKGNIASPKAVEEIVAKVLEQAQTAAGYVPKATPKAPAIRVKKGHAHPAFEEVMDNVAAGNNVMMVGPAGCGKTTLGRNVSKVWRNKDFHRVPYTAGASESWILGRMLPTGAGGAFEYHTSRVLYLHTNGGVILHDEMDGADANMLLINNGLTDDGDFINPITNQFHPRHGDAAHVGALNTWGFGGNTIYVGRARLDGATLDRWYPIPVDYDTVLEAKLGRKEVVDFVWGLRASIAQHRIQKVMSTRSIQKAERALNGGRPWAEVKARLCGGWTTDELAKVGL